MSEEVWSEKDTTPGHIEAALRRLLAEHHAEDEGALPARILNLVAVVDASWRGEVANRLDKVGRFHASRTILCAVEPGREEIDASASIASEQQGGLVTTHERVTLDVGRKHLRHLFGIVDPLVVTDLPTLVWSPHGHDEGVDALLPLAQTVLIDSVDDPEPAQALDRALEVAQDTYVVDLAWLRSTPWRERIASAFDPPRRRAELSRISSVTIRHHPSSAAAALLLVGWLSARLGWKVSRLAQRGDGFVGRVRGHKDDVAVTLEPDPSMSVRSLAGITLGTSAGTELALNRGEGGLVARRVGRKGQVREWTVLGASRGEPGILGEGIRASLLRDPTYRPALAAAAELS